MRTNQFQKGDWAKLDLALKSKIKRELKLPKHATTAYIYGDTSDGLFGIPEAAADSDIAKIDSAFKLLTSPDTIVQSTAWTDLN